MEALGTPQNSITKEEGAQCRQTERRWEGKEDLGKRIRMFRPTSPHGAWSHAREDGVTANDWCPGHTHVYAGEAQGL